MSMTPEAEKLLAKKVWTHDDCLRAIRVIKETCPEMCHQIGFNDISYWVGEKSWQAFVVCRRYVSMRSDSYRDGERCGVRNWDGDFLEFKDKISWLLED